MVKEIPDILARIVEHKRLELGGLRAARRQWERQAEEWIEDRRPFAEALRSVRPALIAEIKKASPSKGVLAADFNPAVIAQAYERGGAAALSVLTDRKFFQGSLDDLCAARRATRLPVLRKDFVIDEWHVTEAAAHGADAVLLIAAILPLRRLTGLREHAEQFRMDALVEVHDEDELAKALDSGARLIGVNNRDLRTFDVSLETSFRLVRRIPEGVIKISESGIESREQIRQLAAEGFDGFLLGEHLMKAPDPEAALRALTA